MGLERNRLQCTVIGCESNRLRANAKITYRITFNEDTHQRSWETQTGGGRSIQYKRLVLSSKAGKSDAVGDLAQHLGRSIIQLLFEFGSPAATDAPRMG